jgi:hypothetical protein
LRPSAAVVAIVKNIIFCMTILLLLGRWGSVRLSNNHGAASRAS